MSVNRWSIVSFNCNAESVRVGLTCNHLSEFLTSIGEEGILINSEAVGAAIIASKCSSDSELTTAFAHLGTIDEQISSCLSFSLIVGTDEVSELSLIDLDLATLLPEALDAIVTEGVAHEVAELEVSGETVVLSNGRQLPVVVGNFAEVGNLISIVVLECDVGSTADLVSCAIGGVVDSDSLQGVGPELHLGFVLEVAPFGLNVKFKRSGGLDVGAVA